MLFVRDEQLAWRWTWFMRAWAVAALFHLAAEPREAVLVHPALAVCSVLLALMATFTLLNPQRSWALLGLWVLVPVHAWLEAPVIGNHWVLAALVSLTFLINALLRRVKSPGLAGVTAASGPALRAARITVLTAYSFAAFAKLNWDFVNPDVSCVVLFQARSVESWGLSGLSVAALPPLGSALAWTTIGIEVAVAALLAFPRTRRAGLVLAFGFHWALALDLAQHFWDFSSVLFAGFLLFLDDQQVLWLQQQLGRRRAYQPSSRLAPLLIGIIGLSVGLLNVLPLHLGYRETLSWMGHVAWWIYGTGLMAAVIGAGVLAPRPGPVAQQKQQTSLAAWLWLGPALALLNGLTPYLEIKTGFGWNMYSNLRTVAGKTNHMLLPSTWDTTGAQRDLVYIIASPDPALQQLHDKHYALTYSEFREYAHRFPDSAATFQWKGVTHTAQRLGDDPLGQGNLSVVDEKLLSFRAVDLENRERCQAAFSPAR